MESPARCGRVVARSRHHQRTTASNGRTMTRSAAACRVLSHAA